MTSLNHTFCVAPMLDWTDRHCRFFLRQISRHALLYTEMVTTNAIVHADRQKLLRFDAGEHPVALQLGGAHADELARCAEIGEQFGYREINLNCGCPSDRVQEASFGALLMKDPDRVARGVAAMRGATSLPVTVKSRIGVDDSEEYPFLRAFVETVAAAGCDTFIVHARKAWLKGLSPKENREVPPLNYEVVLRLKQDYPQLKVILNGGLKTLEECHEHLKSLDGVMLGREVYENPYILAEVDRQFFGATTAAPTREQVVHRLMPYVARELERGVHLHHITRHILGLYRGRAGGRAFRRFLSENAGLHDAGTDVIEMALLEVETPLLPHAAAA
ncbi:MAG TPA: tRNA dihydrouridine(20/20a) synthase DusA [Candidatus Binatia bacterium]|nr:tRNA dihydrouridine(20/20a) synthase DusA [Candidatus Binatia bacterium]